MTQALSNEQIARIAHEANRVYCLSLADTSQKSWDAAPDWQKNSAVAGVEFLIANPEAGPEANHNSWLEVKKREGWQYGEVKNEKKREHPCFVPYEELPVSQQRKDKLFGAIVRACLDL